jgi:hypothetical protein
LSSVPIFAKISLKDNEVERLVKMLTRLTFRKGRTLIRRGGYPGVYVIHVDLSPTDFSKKLVELKKSFNQG